MSDYFAMVMAGGSGTRFWPMSRTYRPKQLLPLLGSKPMIRETVDRLIPLFPPERIFVICGRAHRDAIQEALDNLTAEQVIDEPEGRDTAAAVGLAATFLEWRSPGCTFCALPADAYIGNVEKFQETLQRGFEAAADGALVTIGVKPTRPATGYGYLQRGTGLKVARFCEKPDLATAKTFVASGQHYWNCGIFIWKAASILAEIKRHLPEHAARLEKIGAALGTSGLPQVLATEFRQIPKISIDYGVMEKASNVKMIDATFEWDDVGSWSAVLERRPRDAQGNSIEALAATVDTNNSVIVSTDDKHLIATLGLEGFVVVHTADATLICPRDRAEDLKKLVDKIRADGREKHL